MRNEKTFTVTPDLGQELAQTISHFFCEDALSSSIRSINDLLGNLTVLEADESQFEVRHSYISESVWHVTRLTNLLVKLYELNERIDFHTRAKKEAES